MTSSSEHEATLDALCYLARIVYATGIREVYDASGVMGFWKAAIAGRASAEPIALFDGSTSALPPARSERSRTRHDSR